MANLPGRGGPRNVITDAEFNRLANEGYNRIPLIAQAFADLETPLSLYLKLTGPKGGDAPATECVTRIPVVARIARQDL